MRMHHRSETAHFGLQHHGGYGQHHRQHACIPPPIVHEVIKHVEVPVEKLVIQDRIVEKEVEKVVF